MRVLFTAAPGAGHVLPLVSLAWAMRAAGHEILVLTAGRGLTAAAKAGLPLADYAPGMTDSEISDHIVSRFPASMPPEASRIKRLVDAAGRVCHIARFGADHAVRIAKAWQPDLVVHEPLNAAGPITASALGIPAVQHLYGFPRGVGLSAELYRLLRDDFDRLGAPGLPETTAVLDIAPPSLLSGAPEGWSMRHVPHNGGTLPESLEVAPTGVPRITITLGTEQVPAKTTELVNRLSAAAADVAAEVVLALGGVDPGPIEALPPNVRIVPWLPLDALLNRSSAVVHHGGASTTMTALAAGIPQLVLPNGADRHASAEAVADGGAGLACAADELTGALLTRLVTDEKLRLRAAEVRNEIAAMPSPAVLVHRLEALTR
jgi:UDP:flavonoid glycosyltransferase YjiC (YdhE family)